jgi:predicted polyphosphate/ATP-dependent NAD kinase
LVETGLNGDSSLDVSVGEIGDVTGVEDAIVPPTPMRDVTGTILSGAFRVMEQDVGGMIAAGVTNAGLCGDPIAITKGMLEVDAALILRSGGDGGWKGIVADVDPAEPARRRKAAG